MSPDQQRGASLIIALFILVVMLLLGTALVRILDSQDDQMVLEVNGTRAWAAGQAGLEWGLARVLNRGGVTAAAACGAAATTLSGGAGLPAGAGLGGCRVQLSCAHTAFTLEELVHNRFIIRADASCGSGGLVVSRSFESQAFD
ncbi:hypothetical protein FCL40_01270 [Ferrimonas sediminicola]|uniref:MSHA biogenesis protein MshP n=1 Tax=Ferrimonas sediminicola TaxID=2569538 RepID=A0A4U1BIA4_9GAMM|nr:hypothetical protein [Ferrimonas sediminicola]TKB51216.1 hypothetical protein FCL40_01270 [Ferrimonas sediminicola]